MMCKVSFFLLWAVLLLCIAPGQLLGDENADTSARDRILNVRDTIVSYFTPLSGEVIAIEGDSILTRIEKNEDVAEGMRLSVYRKGNPFYHPVTNELVGYAEDYVGRIQVQVDTETVGHYRCVKIKGDIQSGDTVRITSSKINLAFFQDKKSDWITSEKFYDSLKNSGRFEVLEKFTPSYEPPVLAEIAREIGAEVILMFSTPRIDRNMFLHADLYWVDDASKFRDMKVLIGRDEGGRFSSEDEFIFESLIDREPWGSFEIEGGRLFAIGDVNNNGVREIVVSDGNNMRIYSIKDVLQEIWMIEGRPEETHLSIDILDSNENGIDEIFVTSLVARTDMGYDDRGTDSGPVRESGVVRSYVIEYAQDSGYKKILNDVPYFFRVNRGTLLMQKFAPKMIFHEPVYKGEWRESRYVPVEPLKLPAGVNIYGFVQIEGERRGSTRIMSFDDDGYLSLYDENGSLLWRSEQSYGKFELTFAKKSYSPTRPLTKWSIRGKLHTIRTERGQEVIVVHNIPLVSKVPGLGARGAEVFSLWWDGSSMDHTLVLKQVPGTITDYWVEDGKMYLIGPGNMISLLKNTLSGDFAKGGVLYYYNFGEK